MVEFVFIDEFVNNEAKIGGVCLETDRKSEYSPIFLGVLFKNYFLTHLLSPFFLIAAL
jgi:hypothetical protein